MSPIGTFVFPEDRAERKKKKKKKTT